MVWPLVGAIAGGIFANSSSRNNNRFNARQSLLNYKRNAAEARAADWRQDQYNQKSEKRAEAMQIRAEGRAAARLRQSENLAYQRLKETENRAWNRLDPKNHRKRMEAAGFNPLASGMGSATNIGSVSTVGAVSSVGGSAPSAGFVNSSFAPASFVGSTDNGPAIARIIAQGIEGIGDQILAKDQMDIQRQQVDMERTRLNMLARKMVMTPKIPGVYGGRNARDIGLGTERRSNSGRDSSGDMVLGSTASSVAPNRDVEVNPYTSGAGLTEISNAVTDALGGPIVVPGSDGEPWGIDELATAVIVGAPQPVLKWAYSTGAKARVAGSDRVYNPKTRTYQHYKQRPYKPKPKPGWMSGKFGNGWMTQRYR